MKIFRDKKRLRRSLIILLVVVILGLIYVFGVRPDMSDFSVCYKGGKRILAGETLYRIADGHLQYKYSPPSALFFIPLSIFPFEVAKSIWYILQIASMFAIFSIYSAILFLGKREKMYAAAFAFLILAKFIGRELELGQVNFLILLVLTAMLKAFLKQDDIRSGLFWGFSLFFKPYALVFLPYFILKKRYQLLVSGLGISAAGLLLPSIFYGFPRNFKVLDEWIRSLSLSSPPLLAVYDNSSLYGFIVKNFFRVSSARIGGIVLLVFLFFAGVFLWMMKRGKKIVHVKPEILETSFLCLLIPIFSPLGWYYNYLYSAFAAILLLIHMKKFPSGLKYALIADFAVIGGSLREILGENIFCFYTQHTLVFLNFLFVLFCLFYMRYRKWA